MKKLLTKKIKTLLQAGLYGVSMLAFIVSPVMRGVTHATGIEITNIKTSFLQRDAYGAIVPSSIWYSHNSSGDIEVYPTLTADVVTSPGGAPVSADWETVLYNNFDHLVARQLHTGSSVSHTAEQVIHTAAGPSYRWAASATQASNSHNTSTPIPISSWVAGISLADASNLGRGKVTVTASTRIITDRGSPNNRIFAYAEPEDLTITYHKTTEARAAGAVKKFSQLKKDQTGVYTAVIDLPADAKGSDVYVLAEIHDKAGTILAQSLTTSNADMIGSQGYTDATPSPSPTPTTEQNSESTSSNKQVPSTTPTKTSAAGTSVELDSPRSMSAGVITAVVGVVLIAAVGGIAFAMRKRIKLPILKRLIKAKK